MTVVVMRRGGRLGRGKESGVGVSLSSGEARMLWTSSPGGCVCCVGRICGLV